MFSPASIRPSNYSTPVKGRPRVPSRLPSGTSTDTSGGPTDSNNGSASGMAAVSLEYASLRFPGHCPLGMYVTPSPESLLVWDVVMFVHQADGSVLKSAQPGYYTDSILKFRLVFPSNYPDRPPAVQFLTDVFHPLISQEDGTFNLDSRFRPWRPKEHHVFDVLHWVKAAFKKHALDDVKESECLNKEAFRYHDTTSSFAALATQSSMLSQSASALFDKDHPSMAGKGSHSMLFRELSPDQLDTLRRQLGLKEWEDPSTETKGMTTSS